MAPAPDHLPAHPNPRHSGSPMRLTRPLVAGAVVLVTAAGASLAGTPTRGANPLLDPSSYLQTDEESVAPGVDLTGYESPTVRGAAQSNLVTADLTRPGVRAGLLLGAVTDIAPIAQRVASSGAVAGVNGDYYAIGGTQAPQGPLISGGRVVKATRVGANVVGQGTDGLVRLGRVDLVGTATWASGKPVPLDALNSDLGPVPAGRDAVAVFDGRWGGRGVAAAGGWVVAVVDRHGRVVATSKRLGGQRVPPGGLLLAGRGRWTSIAKLPTGSHVGDAVSVRTEGGIPSYSWALGVGLPLVSGGRSLHAAPPDDSDAHAARTALGWSDGGRRLYLLTVQRDAGSVGHGANEVADELAALGATDGVLLDGGGSTTLLARARGTAAARQVGGQEDGFERPVPVGVGIFVPRGDGRLAGVDVQPDSGAVFPGFTRRVALRGYDQWYGPAPVTSRAVSVGSVHDKLTAVPGVPLALRAGDTGFDLLDATLADGTTVQGPPVRVLAPIARLQSLPDQRIEPGHSVTLHPVGSTADGASAPVDGLDISVTADPALVHSSVGGDGSLVLTARPGTAGAVSTVTLVAGGVHTYLTVRNGYRDVALSAPGGGGWSVLGGRSDVQRVDAAHGPLARRLALPATGVASVRPKQPVALPAGTSRLALWVRGDGRHHDVQGVVVDGSGHRHTVGLGAVTASGWVRLDASLPRFTGTVRLVGLVVHRAAEAAQAPPGTVLLGRLSALL